jgi:hypothetical protein
MTLQRFGGLAGLICAATYLFGFCASRYCIGSSRLWFERNRRLCRRLRYSVNPRFSDTLELCHLYPQCAGTGRFGRGLAWQASR